MKKLLMHIFLIGMIAGALVNAKPVKWYVTLANNTKKNLAWKIEWKHGETTD